MRDALYGGVNAAALTAVREDLSPDIALTAAHARWLLGNGCDGLGVLGTTGEANSFGLAERQAILEGLAEHGIPARRMMPGTGTTNLADTVLLTRHAASLGCPGVLVLPPFYYKNPSEDGLLAYFSELVQRTGGGTAIYLYHFPQQSAVPFTLSLVERLLRAHPGAIRGMKDSSGDYANTRAMIDAFAPEGFEVYCGSDERLMDTLRDGGAGGITATSNGNSRWAAIVHARREGPEAEAAQAMLAATRRAANTVPLIPGLHALFAHATGQGGWRHIRPPHLPLTPGQERTVLAAWEATGALPMPGLPQAA